MKTFEDYYDLKQPNIVKWYGRLYNIADDIDRYYLEKCIEHHRYRLLYRNSIEGKLRTEYTLYRKELINRINSSPVNSSKAQYTDNSESTIAIVFNSEYPDYPCDTFDIAGTPREILGDFYTHTAAINRLLLETDKPVWIYARGLYTALGIAYTEHSNCDIAYVEHGVNNYSWTTNPHCRRHRIAKDHDRSYEPIPKHKSTILTAWDHQTTAENITDPVRHLSESPRITYALEPETAGLELYQDYIYDWKSPHIQIVTEHHAHHLRLFIKNLTNR